MDDGDTIGVLVSSSLLVESSLFLVRDIPSEFVRHCCDDAVNVGSKVVVVF